MGGRMDLLNPQFRSGPSTRIQQSHDNLSSEQVVLIIDLPFFRLFQPGLKGALPVHPHLKLVSSFLTDLMTELREWWMIYSVVD